MAVWYTVFAMDKTNHLIERIEINPKKLGGKPVIHGTRISVEQVLRMLAAGVPHGEILEDFPDLREEDIRAAVEYASHLVHDFEVYPKEYFSQIQTQPA